MLTRRQFNGLVAAGAGACLVGCNGGAPDGTVTPASGQVVLPFTRFAKLAAAGGSVVVDVSGSFPLVVVRTGVAAAIALSATCTHSGCLVDYASGAMQVQCPCHGAAFSLQGAVLAGPTAIPLPSYAATVGADAITVAIG